MTTEQQAAIWKVMGDVLSLGQRPSGEYDIDHWLGCLEQCLSDAWKPLVEAPDLNTPAHLQKVRDQLTMLAAVAIACVASMDQGAGNALLSRRVLPGEVDEDPPASEPAGQVVS